MGSTSSDSSEITIQQRRAHLQRRLQELHVSRRRPVPPNPPPRYDEIFALGQQWLDRLAAKPEEWEEP
jgi:hypothetical protein